MVHSFNFKLYSQMSSTRMVGLSIRFAESYEFALLSFKGIDDLTHWEDPETNGTSMAIHTLVV